jgi:phage recombination protein Bet
MSTALAIASDFTREQLELIKSTVAKGATDDELKLFLYRCTHMGLDPLKPGQVHFVKYGTNPGTVIVGIDGFRSKAAKTKLHTGTKRGVLRDDKGKCIGAWCEVYRKDWTECAREEVSLVEYNSGKSNWLKMPETMIKKVAEAAALRMAFPDELGGVYSDDEMSQAEPITAPVQQEVKNPLKELRQEKQAVKSDLGEFVIPMGKFKDQKLKDLDSFELNNYLLWLKSSSEKQGKPLGKFQEFYDTADAYLCSLEFGQEPKFDSSEEIA